MKFEKAVEEYLNLKSASTAEAYSAAFKSFAEFYGGKYGSDKGLVHFLDRIYEEFKEPIRDQDHIAEKELKQFIDYLKNKGKADNSIRLYFAAVQNFLKYKYVTVSMSFIGNMPKPHSKKTNGKHEWKIEQLKEFVDAAPSYREKALIMCMFQSGLAVNEICELNYGDVREELASGTLPICLRLDRKKTGVEFKTFFGYDAVKYLRLYLATRGKLKASSPLFTKQRARKGETRITPTLIQQSFVEIAKNLNFIDNDRKGYNPARPHSLRAAFNSRLIGKIDETLREFWMGHTIGAVAKAYLNMPTEELRKLYMTAEEYLCVEKTSRQEIEEKGRQEPIEVNEKIASLTKRVEEQKATIEKLYTFVHKKLDPVMDLFNEIADTPEGVALIKKLQEEKQAKALQTEGK